MSGYDIPEPPEPTEENMIGPNPAQIAHQAESEQVLANLQYPGRVKAAFLVFLTEEGMWVANSNLNGTELERLPDGRFNIKDPGKLPPLEAMAVERPATLQEIGHACQVVGFDVQNMLVADMAAGRTMTALEIKTQQMQAQLQGAAIMEKIQGPLGANGKPFGA